MNKAKKNEENSNQILDFTREVKNMEEKEKMCGHSFAGPHYRA